MIKFIRHTGSTDSIVTDWQTDTNTMKTELKEKIKTRIKN